MLVLTRRVGERIVIPALGITVTLIRAADGKARIGLDAPRDAVVYREELWLKIRRREFESVE